MAIDTIYALSPNTIEIPVTFSGLEVSIPAAEFVHQGQTKNIDAYSYTLSATAVSEGGTLFGYLVEDLATHEVQLACLESPATAPIRPNLSELGVSNIRGLFVVAYPAGVTDLAVQGNATICHCGPGRE